jgi:hypothetical protein
MNVINDRRTLAGLILVVVGLAVLAREWFALTDAIVLGAIGAAFLLAYAFTRRYGFLVPGMILGSAAVGNGLQDSGNDPSGGLVALAIGAGFLGIYLVDAFVRDGSRWWPLIPGTILALIGANALVEAAVATDLVARLSPLVLVIAGAIILAAAWRRTPTVRPTEGG